ncbi:uncharacterized protein LOC132053689 [Lycium ferocissimum]|uniref:uncharacterized protein LOC132053689 n=1 Tax=Lycium ferocissimum TaxID=112874 RepID=UPI0028157A13|nr:uncharacterized protein LOC132053689 [Lycium ferocissimum]
MTCHETNEESDQQEYEEYDESTMMPEGLVEELEELEEKKKPNMAQKAIKGQAIANLLAERTVNDELELLRTFFPDEEVLAMEKELTEPYKGWRLFFDGAVNYKGSGIGAGLISETGQHYLMATKLNFSCTNNMAEYEACVLDLRMALDINILELLVIGDSDLLINQSFDKGHLRTIQDNLQELYRLLATDEWSRRGRQQKHQENPEEDDR